MHIIGIDEAGRGSLAGPVVVAAVVIPKGFYPQSRKLPTLKDSKKLSPRQRNLWFEYIKNHPAIFYETARVYEKQIEQKNITNSANLAASRLFKRVEKKSHIKTGRYSILLDGGLYINKINRKIKTRTIIKGDEKITAIKLASIVAKVTRDKYMIKLSIRYPIYGFNIHKGYGTELHRKMIREYGPSEAHRLTFVDKLIQ
jgi:ribonuclease HII